MKILGLIALDSIRSLLHQRLLLGLILLSFGITAIFSAALIGQRKIFTRQAMDASVANASGHADPAIDSGATPGHTRTKPRVLTKEEQAKLTATMDEVSSVFQAFFYQTASFGGSLVALFIFSTAVAGEIRKGTIRLTLTKPVSRSQFLLGKYLGGIVVMAGYALISSLAIILFARFGHLDLSPAMKFAPWLMFCRQLMLGSLAMLLSLFVHPFVASLLAFFAGNGLYAPPNPLFYLFPSYSAFNVFKGMLAGSLMNGHDVLILSLYAADFVIVMLLLALWRFRHKELV